MIIRKDVLDPEHTLFCGQAFRWRRSGEGYIGVVNGCVVEIREEKNGDYRVSWQGGETEFYPVRYFRLDENLDEVYRKINVDVQMDRIISRYRGLRLLRQEPFETLISFILSQASNIPRISRMVETISRKYGGRIDYKGSSYYSFPTPQQLKAVRATEFRGMGMGYRASYVRNALDAVLDGSLDLEKLRHLPYLSSKAELMKVHGVGEKIADCVLLFSLDKLEAFPVDRWVMRIVGDLYFNGGPPSGKRLWEWAGDYFGDHAGYAQQYLYYFGRKKGREGNADYPRQHGP